MGVEKYIKLSSDNLYSELINDILNNPERGKCIIDELLASERYNEDYQFRLIVDLGRAITFNVFREFNSTIPVCEEMIERAMAYKMWRELTVVYNVMGNAFTGLGVYERAIEFYLRCIHVAQKYEFPNLAAAAFANIGLNYSKVEKKEKEIEFLKLAINALEEGGEDKLRYREKKLHILSDMALELCRVGKLEEAKEILDNISGLRKEGISDISLYEYDIALMCYLMMTGEKEKGRKKFRETLEFMEKTGVLNLPIFVAAYTELCLLSQTEFSFFINDIIPYENDERIDEDKNCHIVYMALKDYYKEIGNQEKYNEITEKMIRSLIRNSENMDDFHSNSISLVENFVKKSLEEERLSDSNLELKRIADEAVKAKNALEEAYQRIEVINALGRKLTSSLNIQEVFELIYDIVKNNMPMDSFEIVVPDQKEEKLISLVNYEYGKLVPRPDIPLSRKNSIFVDCYKSSTNILSWKQDQIHHFKEQHEEEDRPSAMFMPLIVGNKTIGVWTVQYIGANVYTDESVEFLKAISPYLSIAINNALRSWELEKEIRSHLKTQKEMELLNAKLERMSSIDGLTEINSRRVFELKIQEFIREAQDLKLPIAILMIDIDNFKRYNDNYGHLEGDMVLKTVAQLFGKIMDENKGLSARFGGEEFIGAMIGLHKKGSLNLAEQIREEIKKAAIVHKFSDFGVITVSIGVCYCEHIKEGMKSQLMKVADDSLYEAKNSGKNKVVLTEV